MFTLGPWEAGTLLDTVDTAVSGKDLCSSY